MKHKKVTTRYILSVLIDYVILMCIVFFLSTWFPQDNPPVKICIVLILLSLYFVQDKIFGNKSIGKIILCIEINSLDDEKTLSLFSVIIRRFLELLYVYKLFFWRLYINIDKISNSKIVYKNRAGNAKRVNDTGLNKKRFLFYPDKSLMIARAKAFLIDSLLISWAYVALCLINMPSVILYFESISQYFLLSIHLILVFTIGLYWIFRDLLFRNKSIGKRVLGIEVTDLESKIPSRLSLIVKNTVSLGFAPIELLFFLLNRRGIGEQFTYTITIKTNKNASI